MVDAARRRDDVAELRDRLARAVHPLAAPPNGPGWNLDELDGLLPARPLVSAAVLIPIVPRASGATVVLTLRTAALRHHAGQVSFPGGRIEASDRDAADAAVREAFEEIALSRAAVEPIGYLERYVTITGFIVTPTVAFVDPAAAFEADRREVDEVFEVPLAFLLDPAARELRTREFMGRPRQYHAIEFGGREIWGATAAMIVNLADRLEGR